MMTTKFTLFIFAAFLLTFFLSGCIGSTSQQPAYYVLNASRALTPIQDSVLLTDIGVGPVKIPGFLDRSQIVTRQGENNLGVNEFHRWGDSLEAQVTIVLAENLSKLLGMPNVSAYPWDGPFIPKYQVYVDIRQFHGKPGDAVSLKAMWWVVNSADDKQIKVKRSSILVPTVDNTFDAYVGAQNIALEKLSIEIAEGLISFFNT